MKRSNKFLKICNAAFMNGMRMENDMNPIDPEIKRVAQQMMVNLRKELDKIMLEAGMTSEEIQKIVEKSIGAIRFGGAPVCVIACSACGGKGYITPEQRIVHIHRDNSFDIAAGCPANISEKDSDCDFRGGCYQQLQEKYTASHWRDVGAPEWTPPPTQDEHGRWTWVIRGK